MATLCMCTVDLFSTPIGLKSYQGKVSNDSIQFQKKIHKKPNMVLIFQNTQLGHLRMLQEMHED